MLACLVSAQVPASENETAVPADDTKQQMKLAAMYLHGRGVEADVDKAIELYQALAERNIAFAQYRLARIYLDGEHVRPDTELALQILPQACGLIHGVIGVRRQRAGPTGRSRYVGMCSC